MKTVFTSNEIAHVWAHKSASYGRCPSNMHFTESYGELCFYSYNTVIARHTSHKGKAAVILNIASFSISTSGHQSYVRAAIRGLPVTVFCVSDHMYGTELRFTGAELFQHYIKQAAKQEKAALLPRIRQTTRDSHKAQAAAFLEDAKRVVEFYGLRKKVDEKAIERLATAKARAEKRERIAREKRDNEERLRQSEAYEAWKRGESLSYEEIRMGARGFQAFLFPVAFRVEGEELVSTLGARVPLQAARVAYRFAMSKRGQAWRENGNSPSGDETCEVGHYQLNAINEHGIVAGCHRIAWAELERLASILA